MTSYKIIPLCLYLLSVLEMNLVAQDVVDFETFDLGIDTFINGNDGSGGFQADPIFLPNDFNIDFQSWTGWSISSMRDDTTPGFTNQYSAIAAGGFESQTYAVAFASTPEIMTISDQERAIQIEGFYITNATYPFLSMRDGDAFAKKFGGETGDDPDYFLLTIKKYLEGELSMDSVNFYLADFRPTDNSQDYLVREWTYVDISTLGMADSLQFSLSSSDIGIFGMNTPGYFCLDKIVLSQSTAAQFETDFEFKVYPNPTTTILNLDLPASQSFSAEIYNLQGQIVRRWPKTETPSLSLAEFDAGNYYLQIRQGNKIGRALFTKI